MRRGWSPTTRRRPTWLSSVLVTSSGRSFEPDGFKRSSCFAMPGTRPRARSSRDSRHGWRYGWPDRRRHPPGASPDHIVLRNGIEIFLLDGVSGDHIVIGRSFTAHSTLQDGKTLANAIQLNSDGLLDALASVTFSG